MASDRSTVDAFYAPAMGIGAKDDGKPGLRPQYQLQTPVESILQDLRTHLAKTLN